MNAFFKQEVSFSSRLLITDSVHLGKNLVLTYLKLLDDFENLREPLLLRLFHGS